MVTAAIFIVVFSLLAYAAVKFRRRRSDDLREPAQAYGSTQLELAWTVAPVLIVVVLFLASARVIASRTRYSPVPQCSGERSGTSHPTVLKLISVDTDHSFWAPRLAGKTDLIPNHPNTMWVEPHEIGLYLG
jgi:cytochrome c oxidase subunit 2